MISKYNLGKEIFNSKISDNNFITRNIFENYINQHGNSLWLNPVKSFQDFTILPINPEIGDRYISATTYDIFIKDHIYEYILEDDIAKWQDTNETKDGTIIYSFLYNGIDHGKVQNMLIYIDTITKTGWFSLYDDVDIGQLETRVNYLEQDMTTVKTDITNIQTDIAIINNNIFDINGEIITLETNINNCVKLTDNRIINLSNTDNNMQIGTLKLGSDITNSLNNILINSSANSILNTDVVSAGYLNAKNYVQQIDTNLLNFSNVNNNMQIGTLKLGSDTINYANKLLFDISSISSLNTDIITAGYLNARNYITSANLSNYVQQTDTNLLTFSNIDNNIQIGTLKLGSDTINYANNLLIDTSINSILNTDIITAGYLNAKNYVQQTDTNLLTFSNIDNNMQIGILKLGSNTTNYLNNILTNSSANSILNTDIVTAGYLNTKNYLSSSDLNNYVQQTDTNLLTFSNINNNMQIGTLKLGSDITNSLNNILINSSANSILNTDVVSAGYLNARNYITSSNLSNYVQQTETNLLTFSNIDNNIQIGTLKLGSDTINYANKLLFDISSISSLNTDIITAGYLNARNYITSSDLNNYVQQTDTNLLTFSNIDNNIQIGTLKLGSDITNSLNNILINSSSNSILNTDVVSAG